MTISMYGASVPTVLRQIQALVDVLDIAERHAAENNAQPAAFLISRLYPDMLALAQQVQAVSLLSVRGLGWLADKEPPAFAPFDLTESFEELRARLGSASAFIATLAPADIDGTEEKTIIVTANSGSKRVYRGEDYLLHYYLPNLFFHTTVAYGLFRHGGVPLGKRHYLGVQPGISQ